MREYIKVQVDWFVEQVARREPFTFTRWGDGEWLAVLELLDKAQSPEQDFLPELCRDVREVVLSRPSYRLGMQPYALRLYGESIEPFIVQHNLEDLDWIWSDVFHHANIHGELVRVASEIRSAPLVFVGPEHLRGISEKLDAHAFIEVPAYNAYHSLADVLVRVEDVLRGASGPSFVSVSMGIAANILIHRLYRQFSDHMLCDMGSVWDVHAGVKSRGYMQKVTVPPIM
jgi:hypothetical protein